MLDEILVIRESLPIFYYNKDPDVALSDDWYILQSGFFVALSQFANEMSKESLRYVILENKLYALDELSNIMIIFGDKRKMTQDVIDKMHNDISKASNYLSQLIIKHDATQTFPSQEALNGVATDFGDYLKQANLVEDDSPFDVRESRSMMQKFIFKSIGYKPGQCNIGPAQRMKRLLIGMTSFPIAAIGAILIWLLNANALWALTLVVPLFMGFFGIFQYIFKFCAINGLTKKYDMR
ncbi:MAG: hypothetical protein FK733_17915 [Asgard group archaeon]|nr:hypothetical protein [Asgard group archaeon]